MTVYECLEEECGQGFTDEDDGATWYDNVNDEVLVVCPECGSDNVRKVRSFEIPTYGGRVI